MVEEFILNYTGPEINDRLEAVDELKRTVNNTLLFDDVPTEGSNRLITSGAIHEAMKNIDVEADVALTAGDLLEIKDGVIRSTLGDETEETVEVFEKLLGRSFASIAWSSQDNVWEEDLDYNSIDLFKEMPFEIGQKYGARITSMDGTVYEYNDITCIDLNNPTKSSAEAPSLIINLNIDFHTGNWSLTDESKPGFLVRFDSDWVTNEQRLWYSNIMSSEYFIGTIVLGKLIQNSKKVGLPNGILKANNLITINDGVISSTLGDPVFKGFKKFYIIDDYEYSTTYNSTGNYYKTYYEEDINGGLPPEDVDVTVELYLQNRGQTYTYEKAKFTYLPDSNEYVFIANSAIMSKDTILSSGFIKKNSSIPAIMIVMWYYDDKEEYRYHLYCSDDFSGKQTSLSVYYTTPDITYIQVPFQALPVDKFELTQNVTSIPSSAAVLSAAENLADSLTNTMYNYVYERTEYDLTPVANSKKLITSGGVYDIIESLKARIIALETKLGDNVSE